MEPVTTKVCKRCGTEKSLSEYYVRKARNNEPHSKCKECTKTEQDQKKFAKLSPEKQEQILQHRKQQDYLAEGKKECGRCKEVKPVTDYMTKAGKIDYAHCSICRPQTDKEYFAKNPEKQSNRHASVFTGRDFVASYTQPLKEVGCADCKQYYPDAMEFDHTCPPSEKLYNIASIHLAKGSSENLLEMLQAELTKGEYVCINCHRKRTISRHPRSSRRSYLINPDDDLLNRNMKYVYDFLFGEKCVDCSEDDFLVLEFDHVRGSKIATLSQMIMKPNMFSTASLDEELSKCEIRCANCHRKRTRSRQIGVEITTQLPKDNSMKHCKCGNLKEFIAFECIDCYTKSLAASLSERYGELEILISRLRASNYTKLAKELGVSDNAIRKHLLRNGIDPKTLLTIEMDEDNENR